MFHKPTVFIIGAGASFEVGLPLGAELKTRVADTLKFRFDHIKGQTDGDFELFEVLKRRYGNKVGLYTSAGSDLAKVIPTFPSMDEALNFFSARPEAVDDASLIRPTRWIYFFFPRSIASISSGDSFCS